MAIDSSLAASSPPVRLSEQKPTPLGRRLSNGELLRRPHAVEEEIRGALDLDEWTLARRADVADTNAPDFLSSECLVHVARRDLRGPRRLVESLVPAVLRRADRNLRRTVGGLPASVLEEIREDILGRLAILLLEPGDDADFFEVRFDLALKRLRIDVYRRLVRRRAPEVDLEQPAVADLEKAAGEHRSRILPADQRAALAEALTRLPAQERRATVLHYLVGMPIASGKAGVATVADQLGVSERTVRNLLTRAKRRLQDDSGESS